MHLIDLPQELLLIHPAHLANIEDFMNTASCCRLLRDVLSETRGNTILRLSAASSRVFFRPDPWFLIAATARQVGRWGLESQENTEVCEYLKILGKSE